jgi:hypothetical protein
MRAVSDFEYELQLALTNRKLNDRFETILMMPKDSYVFLSSSMVKEIAQLGGSVGCFVPPHVRQALAHRLTCHQGRASRGRGGAGVAPPRASLRCGLSGNRP